MRSLFRSKLHSLTFSPSLSPDPAPEEGCQVAAPHHHPDAQDHADMVFKTQPIDRPCDFSSPISPNPHPCPKSPRSCFVQIKPGFINSACSDLLHQQRDSILGCENPFKALFWTDGRGCQRLSKHYRLLLMPLVMAQMQNESPYCWPLLQTEDPEGVNGSDLKVSYLGTSFHDTTICHSSF